MKQETALGRLVDRWREAAISPLGVALGKDACLMLKCCADELAVVINYQAKKKRLPK
jgi:hypothetical protein